MKRFEFRLQKVLDYREAVEGWARDAFLAARGARIAAEGERLRICDRRKIALLADPQDLRGRLALESLLEAIDGQESAQAAVVRALEIEEQALHDGWQERKREMESLQKLREEASREWEIEATRFDQRELDEWAVLRRAA